jgi:hypothetical protein
VDGAIATECFQQAMTEKRMNKLLGVLFAVAVFYRYVRWLLND